MRINLSEHFTYTKLLRFVYPSVIMMIFTSIYTVVDGLFVSNFVGKTEFAALNFIMPVIMILGGIGYMIGTGGSALVAKKLGMGETKKADRYFTMMIIFTVIIGIFFTILGMFIIKPFCELMDATVEMEKYCIIYGTISIGFITMFMLQNVFQSFMVVAERPKIGLFVIVIAGITNAVLDALFIVVFKWGIAGAALATGMGQTVGGLIPVIYFLKFNKSRLSFSKTGLKPRPVIKACYNGISEFMTNIAASIVGVIFNYQLIHYIGENGISAFGVVMYVQFVFVAISIGYTIGTAPIISYHYGANNHSELKNILRKSFVIMGISGVALTIISIIFAKQLSYIFVGYDKELFDLTVHALKIFSVSFLFFGFNIFASSFFTALNNGLISAIISVLRTMVFQTLCILIMPIIFDVDGIWYATVVAEAFALVVGTSFIISNKRKYNY